MADLSGLLKDGLTKAVTRPSIHQYVPHEKQQIFHKSTSKGKLYIGGNRSGKTVGGIAEDIMWLRGSHPYRTGLPVGPVRGRIVTVSYNEGVKEIIIPELAKWIPPSDLINGSWEDSYHKMERKLTLSNGSTCELMSYDQDVSKFAGTSRHFVHFDEEPPKIIYEECKMRLLDTGGSWWMTLTPVNGMSWVYFTIYEPKSPGIMILQIDTDENPYLSTAEIEHTFSDMSRDDQRIRRKGNFIPVGGLVFKKFNQETHVIPERLPSRTATQYMSMDHGYNAPTAWLWHYVMPDGTIITYDELYANETLVGTFATLIHERNSRKGRRPPDVYIGDPAIAQRNGQTGDSIQVAYQQNGIPIMLGNNDVKIGIEKMNRYLQQGKWFITENCYNLIRELQLVRWKVYDSLKRRDALNPREEIHKKDDHAPDSARYLFSIMPELYIPKQDDFAAHMSNVNKKVQGLVLPASPPVGPHMYDTNLQNQRSGANTEWTVVDETVGGWF